MMTQEEINQIITDTTKLGNMEFTDELYAMKAISDYALAMKPLVEKYVYAGSRTFTIRIDNTEE